MQNKKIKQDELIGNIITKLKEINELFMKGPENNLNIIAEAKNIMTYDPTDKDSMNMKKYPEIKISIYKWVRSNKETIDEI